jgi:hypothetical protein
MQPLPSVNVAYENSRLMSNLIMVCVYIHECINEVFFCNWLTVEKENVTEISKHEILL